MHKYISEYVSKDKYLTLRSKNIKQESVSQRTGFNKRSTQKELIWCLLLLAAIYKMQVEVVYQFWIPNLYGQTTVRHLVMLEYSQHISLILIRSNMPFLFPHLSCYNWCAADCWDFFSLVSQNFVHMQNSDQSANMENTSSLKTHLKLLPDPEWCHI